MAPPRWPGWISRRLARQGQQGAVEVGGQDAAPVGERAVHDGAAGRDPGVGDRQVQTAELLADGPPCASQAASSATSCARRSRRPGGAARCQRRSRPGGITVHQRQAADARMHQPADRRRADAEAAPVTSATRSAPCANNVSAAAIVPPCPALPWAPPARRCPSATHPGDAPSAARQPRPIRPGQRPPGYGGAPPGALRRRTHSSTVRDGRWDLPSTEPGEPETKGPPMGRAREKSSGKRSGPRRLKAWSRACPTALGALQPRHD